jgi:hypothetical protein
MTERGNFIRKVRDFDPLPHTPMFGGVAIGVGLAVADIGVIAAGSVVFLGAKLLQEIEKDKGQRKQNRKD